MSGRGKGGKGLGAGAKKARVEPYEWTAEEEVANVAVFNPDDREVSNYTVPWARLPNELAVVMTQQRQAKPNGLAVLRVILGDDAAEENFEVLDNLTKSDLGYDRDEDDDDYEDDELDEDDKSAVIENLEEWVAAKLDFWRKPPTTAVRICGAINFVETN